MCMCVEDAEAVILIPVGAFYKKKSMCLLGRSGFFCKGALFRGKGGPPVLEKPAWHLPRQGRGFVRPPVCPTTFPIAHGFA